MPNFTIRSLQRISEIFWFGSTLHAGLAEPDTHILSRSASKTPVATGVLALLLALPGSEPPSIEYECHPPKLFSEATSGTTTMPGDIWISRVNSIRPEI